MFDEKGILDHLRELDESLKDCERYRSISLAFFYLALPEAA